MSNVSFEQIKDIELEEINGGGLVAALALGAVGGIVGGYVGALTGAVVYVQTGDVKKADDCLKAGIMAGASFGAGVGAVMPTP